jgi:NtrC-family two-component system sensor histidine kinase KinB
MSPEPRGPRAAARDAPEVRTSLRSRLLLAFGAMLLFMAALIAYALVNLLMLGGATGAILRENYRSIVASTHLMETAQAQELAVLAAVAGERTPDERWTSLELDFATWLARARDNVTIQGEADVIDRTEKSYRAYLAELEEARRAPPSATMAIYQRRVLPASRRLEEDVHRLRVLNERTMFDASDAAARIARTSVWSMSVVGFVTFLLGGIFAWVASRRLVRPLHDLVRATRNVTAGQFDVSVSAPRDDEIGLLASEFNAMARRIAAHHATNLEELRREKRKSESVLESIDDAIVVVDERGLVSDMNPRAAALFRVALRDALGKPALDILKEERLVQLLQHALDTGRAPAIPDGADVYSMGDAPARSHYLLSIAPIRGAEGEPGLALLLLRDVTRLKELDRLKSEFVATASHELKSPLTGIGMSLALLREELGDKLDGRQRELLEVADEEVARLKALVAELLELSRIEAGRIELSFEAVEVSALFDQVERAFAAQLGDRGVLLEREIDDGLPRVRVDRGKIAWVLANLVSNALRAVDRGGHVRLRARSAGQQVEIEVQDDGAGIALEHQSRIFDKFVQLDTSVGGTGLGLSICRELVRAHGGAIWVESSLGRGSVFTFTIPRLESNS